MCMLYGKLKYLLKSSFLWLMAHNKILTRDNLVKIETTC
jgi:hypothetical protein